MSLRILARRLLGRKGVFILRRVLSKTALLLGVLKPSPRPNCVTAMICSFNDPDWVKPSISTIADVVDEIVLVDSSTDNTPKLVVEEAQRHGVPVKLIRAPVGDLEEARNLGLRESTCRWILVWDLDFIARRELKKEITRLVETSDSRLGYLVYWPHINLCATPLHVCRRELHVEHWLYTWHPKARYVMAGVFEVLHAPLHAYKPIEIRKPLSLHLSYVRRPDRLAYKVIWWRYRSLFNSLARRGATAEELMEQAKKIALRDYGTSNLWEIGWKIAVNMARKLEVYDEAKYGEYPIELLEHIARLDWCIKLLEETSVLETYKEMVKRYRNPK